jgi:hypothetical protein
MAHEPAGAALVAEFDDPVTLLAAARRLANAGYTRLEAYTPVYIEELAEALPDPPATRISIFAFVAGVLGGGSMFLFEVWAMAIDWHLNVGGRPAFSWPAFIVPTYECVILLASLTAFGSSLALGDMPRPHHPIFDIDAFEHASADRFFVVVGAEDPRFDPERTRSLLDELEPVEVHALRG